MLTVRMEQDLYIKFAVAAKVKGARPSTLVHQYAVEIAREVMEEHPAEFAQAYPRIAQKIADNSAKRKAAIRRRKGDNLNGGPEYAEEPDPVKEHS